MSTEIMDGNGGEMRALVDAAVIQESLRQDFEIQVGLL